MIGEKRIVILGNGFDVDAGLKTKYSEFMSSSIFKQALEQEQADNRGVFSSYSDIKTYGLLHYISEKYHSEKWCDLEAFLHSYAKKGREQIVQGGKLVSQFNVSDSRRKIMFDVLVKALMSYLDSLDYSSIERDSAAVQLLKFLNRVDDTSIWTFNYTDPKILATLMGIDSRLPQIEHIHGTLVNRNAILGFQSDSSVDESYAYMEKMKNPNHSFSGWSARLRNAKSVLIFGHSLGASDGEYFKEYLEFLASLESMYMVRCLDVVTYDDESAEQILRNIDMISNRGISAIKSHVQFNVYKTKSDIIDFQRMFNL